MSSVKIKVKKLHEEAILPRYAHEGDSGMDIFALEETIINPLERKMSGVVILNSPGTIDSTYRGELLAILYNSDKNKPYKVEKYSKVGQIVLKKVEQIELEETKNLSYSSRGIGGLGSTGLFIKDEKSIILGLTGSIASGKDVISEYLKEKEFLYISLSSIIRNMASKYDIEITRKNLQDFGNKLREQHGSGYLAEEALKIIKENNCKKAVIDGIRNPGEIEVLKNQNNFQFTLISVDSSLETRYQRLLIRNKPSDPKTWQEFIKADERDKGRGESETGQGVAKCMDSADFKLINEKDIESFKVQIGEFYNKINKKL